MSRGVGSGLDQWLGEGSRVYLGVGRFSKDITSKGYIIQSLLKTSSSVV